MSHAKPCGAVCTLAKQGRIKLVGATQLIRYIFFLLDAYALSFLVDVSKVRTVCYWPKQIYFGLCVSTDGGHSNDIVLKMNYCICVSRPRGKDKSIENVHYGKGTMMLNVPRDRLRADVMRRDEGEKSNSGQENQDQEKGSK